MQFTVTKVDEDEQDGSSETREQKNKNKNGPVSQFHLLQVRHEKAILSNNFLIRFCLDITLNSSSNILIPDEEMKEKLS